MQLKTAFTRAARAMREDSRLHAVAVSSLTIAFLCLAGSLWFITNLSTMAESWGRSGRMTLYLRDGAQPQNVQQLRLLLETLPDVTAVTHLTASQARDEFIQDSEVAPELAGLPVDVFPASLELTLAEGTSTARAAEIGARIEPFGVVEDVETYQGWFGQLEALLSTGRTLSWVITFVVLFCVVFVISNTIRLSIASRKNEIEVLKLCGASDSFVRRPFLVEGAMQGLVSALLAILCLLIAFVALRGQLDATLAALAGVRTSFLAPSTIAMVVLGGGLLGAAGSAISLRRYMSV